MVKAVTTVVKVDGNRDEGVPSTAEDTEEIPE